MYSAHRDDAERDVYEHFDDSLCDVARTRGVGDDRAVEGKERNKVDQSMDYDQRQDALGAQSYGGEEEAEGRRPDGLG